MFDAWPGMSWAIFIGHRVSYYPSSCRMGALRSCYRYLVCTLNLWVRCDISFFRTCSYVFSASTGLLHGRIEASYFTAYAFLHHTHEVMSVVFTIEIGDCFHLLWYGSPFHTDNALGHTSVMLRRSGNVELHAVVSQPFHVGETSVAFSSSQITYWLLCFTSAFSMSASCLFGQLLTVLSSNLTWCPRFEVSWGMKCKW